MVTIKKSEFWLSTLVLGFRFGFKCCPKVVDHCLYYCFKYLVLRFGGLVDNTLVYISGFVVRQVLRQLSCDVCRGSLVKDTIPTSFNESYHLLILKNKGGLMIPSDGTVKVVKAAERVIRQLQSGQALKVSVVTHVVRGEIGTEDVNILKKHRLELTTTIQTY